VQYCAAVIAHVYNTNRHVECEMCNSQFLWQLQLLNTSVSLAKKTHNSKSLSAEYIVII